VERYYYEPQVFDIDQNEICLGRYFKINLRVKKQEYNWDEEEKKPDHYKIGVGFFATKGIIL
jgi:hypothetical protein